MSLEIEMRAEAERLGLAAVGFAAAGPSRTFDRYRQWLKRGYAAGMDYLARHAEPRHDPRNLLATARTVIVAAARYPSDGGGAYYSRYAQGRDYHDVLREILRALEAFLRRQVGAAMGPTRVCVDTAPLLEREWAVRAGLGWIGRQGCVVHPELGCCLFLGALLTDIALASDVEREPGCGPCRLCVQACPTGAIQDDGTVDARRCLSYLTIEHRGAIPEEFRSLVGATLYGCDCCTAVCPWNRLGRDKVCPALQPAACALPTPEECLALTEPDFQARFAGTPIRRLGLERLQRNAALVLANEDQIPQAGPQQVH